MSARDFFVLGQQRYALPTDCVTEVRNRETSEGAVRSLGHFGLWEDDSEERSRVLRLDAAGTQSTLCVRGQLMTVSIEDEQIVPLPSHFYPQSPAVAFIILDDDRLALLLDPRRLRA